MNFDSMDRRKDDAKLDRIANKVDDIAKAFEFHLATEHEGRPKLAEVNRMIAEHKQLMGDMGTYKDMMARLIGILEGKDVYSELDPTLKVDHVPGLMYEVRSLRQQSQNGGIHTRLQLSAWQRTLITGLIGLLTAIVVLLSQILSNMGA